MNGDLPSRAIQRNAHLYPLSAGAVKQIMKLGAQQLVPASRTGDKGADGRIGPGHPATAVPLVNIYSFSCCLETGGAQPQRVKKIRLPVKDGLGRPLHQAVPPPGFCAGVLCGCWRHTICSAGLSPRSPGGHRWIIDAEPVWSRNNDFSLGRTPPCLL